MYIRFISFFDSKINRPNIVVPLRYHNTKKLIGKNLICGGDGCILCKTECGNITNFEKITNIIGRGMDDETINCIKRMGWQHNKCLVPVLYINDRFINAKVMYVNPLKFNRFLKVINKYNYHNIIHYSNGLQEQMYFIDPQTMKSVIVNGIDYKINSITRRRFETYKDFREKYINEYFTNDSNMWNYIRTLIKVGSE